MVKGPRTQAMRALDARKIPYTVHLFADTIRDAEEVAATVGLPPGQVFKTLVLLREHAPQGRPLLVMVPANRVIDVRHFAARIGVKAVRLAPHDEAERLTGLKVGGISALALLHRPFDVYIDESALVHEWIAVSGGQRGVDLQLRVADVIAIAGARPVDATGQQAGEAAN